MLNEEAQFAAQFERNGKTLLYRRSLKGRAVEVSKAERDAFVERFGRDFKRLAWATLPLGSVSMLAALITADKLGIEQPYLVLPLLAAGLVVWLFARRHLWNEPERALAGRTRVGEERTRIKAWRIMARNMTWAQIVGRSLALAVFALTISRKMDVFHGWARLWLPFFVAIAAIYTVAAKWKWEGERAGR